jgi:AcrR family transcriptional regulator
VKPLRADAERSVQVILQAAERVLSANPAASMEQIAEEAGVARTTIHRRFATREALIDALAASAIRQIEDAVTGARPQTAPPLVSLHQATANVIGVRLAWRFAFTQISPGSPAALAQERVTATGHLLLQRLQQAGLVRADVDLMWAWRVFHGLLDTATSPDETETDPDLLAARIVDTLLHGLGLPAARPAGHPLRAAETATSNHDPRPASTAFASPAAENTTGHTSQPSIEHER